jgi:hypothetical protein
VGAAERDHEVPAVRALLGEDALGHGVLMRGEEVGSHSLLQITSG